MRVHYVILLLYVLEISNKFKNEREDSFEESLIKKKHRHLMKTSKNFKHDAIIFPLNIFVNIPLVKSQNIKHN